MKKLFVILAMVFLFTSCGSGGGEQGADSQEAFAPTLDGEYEDPNDRFQTLSGIGLTETEAFHTVGGYFSLCAFMDSYQENETIAILKDQDGNQLLLFTYSPHEKYQEGAYLCTEKFYMEPGYFYFNIYSKGGWVLTVKGNSWTADELSGV